MTDVDVAALAKLSRLELSDEELASLTKEIPAILSLVEKIQSADVSGISEDTQLRNVLREDTDPYESGVFSERLLSQAPAREGDRIAVKQVVSRKRT